MARKARIHFPGALYHVIARGNRGQKIFRNEKDYQLYLDFLGEYKDRYDFSVYAYTLMPDHVHLLIQVGDVPLSRLMQNLQFRYTRNFNIKYKKHGHLFQGRYKAILCETDSYFLELSAYIHLNAVRAGAVEDPINYRWSSYQSYVRKGKDNLVEKNLLWAQFPGKKQEAMRKYRRFVKRRIGHGHRDDFYELKDQRFLGDEAFVEKVQRRLNEEPPFVYDISLGEIVSEVSSVLGISRDLFHSQNRNRQGALGRSVVGYLARKLGGHKVKGIAEHFSRDPVVISQGIKRLESKLKEVKGFGEKITGIEKSLTAKSSRKILN
jgi:REP element-mobilizing transposase RayT